MNRLVAVTTSLDPQGGDYQQPRIALYANYLTPLERAGLIPVLVTPAHSDASIAELVGLCAGLVLTGGDDIDPALYGEAPIPQLGPVNPRRDAAERRALEVALERSIPVLGICRGHQLINVFFGGTLCQDIATEKSDAASHQQTSPWGAHHHKVVLTSGSRLAQAVGREELAINSYHHQAIRRVAPGLAITARAEDGLIEAVESKEHPWLVGVQWHPERHEAEAADSDPNVRLFMAFGQAVMNQGTGPE
jgi:putative glutamine amidotransferase